MSEADIADHFGVPLEDVQIALASLRTRVPIHRRRTVNVGNAAHRVLTAEKEQHEAMWETVDRILTELHDLRQRAK